VTHGYRNVFGDERVTVSLFETGNPLLDTILGDWFFGLSVGVLSVVGNIASGEVFGQPGLVPNLTNVGAITGAEAFGVPVVSSITFLTNAGAIASAETVNSPVISLWVSPAAIASAEAFGSSSVQPGVSPNAIVSAETFGSPAILAIVLPAGIVSGETLGQPSVGVPLTDVGDIVSAEALGQPTTSLSVLPGAIPSGEALGAPTLVVIVEPAGIASEELFGTPNVYTQYTISPVGVASEEAFGEPTVGSWITQVEGIGSGETFGLPAILPYTLQSYARDRKGNLLSGAEVYVFKTSDKSLISSGTTDSTGFYSVIMLNGNTPCFLVIFHGTSPRRAGVSLDSIVGTLHG